MPFVLTQAAPEVIPEIIDGVDTYIVLFFVALAVGVLQFFCCWKWQNIFVRLIPTVITFLGVVVFFILTTTVSEGWIALGYLAYTVICGILFGATLVGWLAWFIFCVAHGRISFNPIGY